MGRTPIPRDDSLERDETQMNEKIGRPGKSQGERGEEWITHLSTTLDDPLLHFHPTAQFWISSRVSRFPCTPDLLQFFNHSRFRIGDSRGCRIRDSPPAILEFSFSWQNSVLIVQFWRVNGCIYVSDLGVLAVNEAFCGVDGVSFCT